MSWEPPKLSKPDIEFITLALDEYIYYSKQDGIDVKEAEQIWLRLNDHLQKF
jgi:hypothetical protein